MLQDRAFGIAWFTGCAMGAALVTIAYALPNNPAPYHGGIAARADIAAPLPVVAERRAVSASASASASVSNFVRVPMPRPRPVARSVSLGW
jgi:hypothetical protein